MKPSQWFVAHYDFFKDFAGPIATVIAATAAAGITLYFNRAQTRIAREQARIAKQQADLAEMRLKHDIFDRRFKVYEATRNFLVAIFRAGTVSNEELGEFVRGKETAVFLFDQETVDYLDDLYKQASLLHALSSQLSDGSGLPIGTERTAIANRKSELFSWFIGQFEILVARLKPFMALDKHTASHSSIPELPANGRPAS
jgi:hypothetical protein